MTSQRNKQFMNPSNVYWAPPQYTQQTMYPISGNLGFFFNLPYPDPVSAGFTNGEGNENILGKRELVFTTLPEIYAVANVMPTTNGLPRVDPNSFHGRHNRLHYTIRV